MARKQYGKPIRFTIQATSIKDRQDLLSEMCSVMALDLDKELEKLEIKMNGSGVFIVNIDHLFKFFYDKKLKGAFNFEEKTLEVICDQFVIIGNDLIKKPEMIKPNEADYIQGTDISTKEMTPLDPSLMMDEDDDDEPF